jgi:protein SCO1
MSPPNSTKSAQPFLSPWWGLLAIFSIGFPLFFLLKLPSSSLTLHHYGSIPSFILTNQSGEAKTETDYRGKVLVVDFIYTRCQDVCPILTAKLAKLHNEHKEDRIHYLSISVDPKYDQPDVLKHYGDRFSVDHDRWDFLTADQDQIQAVTRGFQQAYEHALVSEVKDAPPRILHSEKFIVVDTTGEIRGFFDTDKEGLQELELALSAL